MALPILDGNQSATTLSTILSGGEHTPAHTVVSLGSTAISNITSAVSGSVVSISNFPSTQTIAGTVTANGGDFAKIPASETSPPEKAIRIGFGTDENWNGVGLGSSGVPLPVAIFDAAGATDGISFTNIGGNSYANVNVGNSVTIGSLPAISGTVTVGSIPAVMLLGSNGDQIDQEGAYIPVSGINGNPVGVSGTVTVGAMPNGALTTRFGSVTTANTAQISSAATNSSRKYLLIQNVTTGSNVITVGIGFTPTTTQGIQLSAGAGITFESSYIPTGAVYVLSSVTASNFTVLEA